MVHDRDAGKEALRRSRPALRHHARGFTLIELLVVTAILVIVSGMVLANHSRFGGKILLQNLAYDMALSVRQAQVYGISVRRTSAGTFGAGYGAHFSTATQVERTSYILFADSIAVDGMLTSGETVQTYSIDRGFKVSKLCAPAGVSAASCTSVTTLDVLYKRPEPDAWISANGNSCVSVQANCIESARVVLSAPSGDTVDFIVDLNGQVAVDKN